MVALEVIVTLPRGDDPVTSNRLHVAGMKIAVTSRVISQVTRRVMSRPPLFLVRVVIPRSDLKMPMKGRRSFHRPALVLTRAKVQTALTQVIGQGMLLPVVGAKAKGWRGARGIEIVTMTASLVVIMAGPHGHIRVEMIIREGGKMNGGAEDVIGTAKMSATTVMTQIPTNTRSLPHRSHLRSIVDGLGRRPVFWRRREPNSLRSGRLRLWPRKKGNARSENKAFGTIVYGGGEGINPVELQ
mmetsp:Transcript_1280/g.2990  ORF Transcript_1280/g.2990 Transcript_1280/m.2990 type:complete len:242 (+) Transcript_1280:1250-1975(+)